MYKMFKKIVAGTLALALVFGATGLTSGNLFSEQAVITATAETGLYEDFPYVVHDDGTIEITRYNDLNGAREVTIPSEIDGKKVTRIGIDAFSNCSDLEVINIPNSIIEIGNSFYGCRNLKTITIPDSVVNIDSRTFEECTSLESIIVDSENKNYSSYDGALYNKNLTELVICPGGKSSIAFPTGVKSIGDSAFISCHNLKSVTIPNSVTTIGESAFESCDSLKSITIPNGVTSIGYSTFGYCTSLESVVIPDSVTEIGMFAFYFCTALKSVTIPKSVENIRFHALGYYYDQDTYETLKVQSFKILCYSGSAGEKYAIENEFEYELLDEPISGSIKVAGEKDTTGVKIALKGADGKESYALVGADGTFSLPALADGSYTLTASKDGYVPHDYAVTIKNGAPTADIAVELKRPGDISGDGKITAVDSAMVNAYVMKTGKLDDYDQKVADVIGNDGSVTAVDCSRINAHVQKTNLLW